MWIGSQPVVVGRAENPNPGSDGTTTSKASSASPPWAVGSLSGPSTFSISTIEPGIGLSLTLWESEAGAQAMAERFGLGASPQANAGVTPCEVREVATTAGPPGQ
jgi:hypothetical protein